MVILRGQVVISSLGWGQRVVINSQYVRLRLIVHGRLRRVSLVLLHGPLERLFPLHRWPVGYLPTLWQLLRAVISVAAFDYLGLQHLRLRDVVLLERSLGLLVRLEFLNGVEAIDLILLHVVGVVVDFGLGRHLVVVVVELHQLRRAVLELPHVDLFSVIAWILLHALWGLDGDLGVVGLLHYALANGGSFERIFTYSRRLLGGHQLTHQLDRVTLHLIRFHGDLVLGSCIRLSVIGGPCRVIVGAVQLLVAGVHLLL